MAHPYFHSISSAHRWGGAIEDYLSIHSWFDLSKQVTCDFRHRALRHHREGVDLAGMVFGSTITNSDNVEVSTAAIGDQHIVEDLGHVPRIADWFGDLESSHLIKCHFIDTEAQSRKSQRKWGGIAADYVRIHQFIDADFGLGNSQLSPRHHSFGVFECEVFGSVVFNSSGRPIPVRAIAEEHISSELGAIPSAYDVIKYLKPKPWMLRVYKPSQAILREVAR